MSQSLLKIGFSKNPSQTRLKILVILTLPVIAEFTTNIYPSPVCLATFKNENSLKSHIKRAHEKKYKCSICDHKFAMKIEWENHRIACLSTECRFCDCPFSREVHKNYMDYTLEIFYMVG